MKRGFFIFLLLVLVCSLTAGAHDNVRGSRPCGSILSDPTDHFRSMASGDWNAITTWESSADNRNWAAASLVPSSAANTIQIRNGHTVTISSDQNMDQVIIESGGLLLHAAGILTINDDASGDDIMVQGGGVFSLASAANAPQFSAATATVNINTGGILRVSATGLTGAGAGVNASNYMYQHASILEYTPSLAFSTSGVTYFPNVDAVTIPVFRITHNMGLVGANSFTSFNGIFEANGNITFANEGVKTFRNGIIGNGKVTGNASCGKFIMNGVTAKLGGSDTLFLPPTGLDIGSPTSVTMVSDKSVTGNIALLPNALLTLGNHHLTMTGNITGGNSGSHIVTNGSGKLVMNTVGGFPGASFPIGATAATYNPLVISNGGGLNYGARVETGINPAIAVPVRAVDRTWVVNPSANPVEHVNINFFYAAGEGNAGFNYGSTVELGLYTTVWNVINTGLVPTGTYEVAGTVNNFAGGIDAPMVIANIGAILVADKLIGLRAQKQQDRSFLQWTVNDTTAMIHFLVERSAEGRAYTALASLPATDLHFYDLHPLPGMNYYRITMVDGCGKMTTSNVDVIRHAQTGFALISISSNPVLQGIFQVHVSAAKNMPADLVIIDMQGRVLQKQRVNLSAGFNTIVMHVEKLVAGIYAIQGIMSDDRSGVIRFVKQ